MIIGFICLLSFFPILEDSTFFHRDFCSLGHLDMYYMFVCMTYIVCASITVSGAHLSALHQAIFWPQAPICVSWQAEGKGYCRGTCLAPYVWWNVRLLHCNKAYVHMQATNYRPNVQRDWLRCHGLKLQDSKGTKTKTITRDTTTSWLYLRLSPSLPC